MILHAKYTGSKWKSSWNQVLFGIWCKCIKIVYQDKREASLPPFIGFIFVILVRTAFESNILKPIETVAIPESFSPILKHFTEMVIKMDLQKLVLHPVSNPLLQTLLLVLHTKNQSLCKKLCKAVMSQIDMFSSKVEESPAQRRPKNDAAEENQGNEEER